MKRILVIIIFLLSTTVCFSNQDDSLNSRSDSTQNDFLKPRKHKHNSDISYPPKPDVPTWDTISKHIDSLKKVTGEVFSMVKDGMKKEGIKVYMRKHADVFIPIVVFIILYLIWLARRARMRN